MKIELTRKITDGEHSGYNTITQEFTELEYKHFLKYGTHDYIEKSIVNGKKVEKLLYRVIEEEVETEATHEVPFEEKDPKEYRKELIELAKEKGLQFAANIPTAKLEILIEEA